MQAYVLYQYGQGRNESEVAAVSDGALGNRDYIGCVYTFWIRRGESGSGEGEWEYVDGNTLDFQSTKNYNWFRNTVKSIAVNKKGGKILKDSSKQFCVIYLGGNL